MLELLAPAGSMESVTAAVQNGADAVYLGYGDFNARRNAKNFTHEEAAAAVSYCHLRGAKVFLTLNTLLTDRELPGAAQVGALLHPVQGVNGHLGGAVEMQVGGHLAQHPGHAQILNDDRVHPHLVDFLRHPGCPGRCCPGS